MRLPMFVAGFFALTSLLIVACNSDENGGDTGGGGDDAPAPKIERPDVPPEFASKTNPFSGDPEEIEKGRSMFVATCATCHGDGGRGDGMAAGPLNPPVTDLTADDFKDVSSQYIYWRITEGSNMEPFRSLRSAMTPYGTIFDDEDRWRLVAFIESLQEQ